LDDVADDHYSFTTAATSPESERAVLSMSRGGGIVGGGASVGGVRRGRGRGEPVPVSSAASATGTVDDDLGGYERPLLSGGGSDSDSVAAVIRGFDDLDVMDDHEP
jgi:hypothetical protein